MELFLRRRYFQSGDLQKKISIVVACASLLLSGTSMATQSGYDLTGGASKNNTDFYNSVATVLATAVVRITHEEARSAVDSILHFEKMPRRPTLLTRTRSVVPAPA
jgi:hypothetical protein